MEDQLKLRDALLDNKLSKDYQIENAYKISKQNLFHTFDKRCCKS